MALAVTPNWSANSSAPASPRFLSRRSSSRRLAGSRSTVASMVSMLRKYQVQVAELVPQVAGVEGDPVGGLQQAAAGDGLEQQQVGGARLVPAGEQPTHGPHTPLRSDEQVGPPLGRRHGAVVAGGG